MPVSTRSNKRRVRFGEVSPSDVREKKKYVLWSSLELDALERAEKAGVRITEKGIAKSDNEDVRNLLQGCLNEDNFKRTAKAIYAKSKKKNKEKPPVAPNPEAQVELEESLNSSLNLPATPQEELAKTVQKETQPADPTGRPNLKVNVVETEHNNDDDDDDNIAISGTTDQPVLRRPVVPDYAISSSSDDEDTRAVHFLSSPDNTNTDIVTISSDSSCCSVEAAT